MTYDLTGWLGSRLLAALGLAESASQPGHTHVAVNVSDSTATGRALMTAADDAAGRTALALGNSATRNVGTAAGTVAAGDDSRITGAVPSARTITAGTGLTGGGDLSANRTLTVAYGTTGTTACVGNDARVTGATPNTRSVATTHSIAGGGNLTADRTLSLVGDVASPGNNQVYGTNGSGVRGWKPDPAGGGGGTKTYAVFTPSNNQPPASGFATLDTRNSVLVLDFDAAADESAVFIGAMPEAAALGSGLTVRLHWMATSATSGNVRWRVAFERTGTDLDADSFDTAVESTSAANGTSGIESVASVTITTIDSITAGDRYRLRVTRVGTDGTNDTMTGDAELTSVEVRSAA